MIVLWFTTMLMIVDYFVILLQLLSNIDGEDISKVVDIS